MQETAHCAHAPMQEGSTLPLAHRDPRHPWHSQIAALLSPCSGMAAAGTQPLCSSHPPVHLQQSRSQSGMHLRLRPDSLTACLPSNASGASHSGCTMRQSFRLCRANASHSGTSTGVLGWKGPYAPCGHSQPACGHHGMAIRPIEVLHRLVRTPMQLSVLRLKVGREKLGTMVMISSSAKNSSCTHTQGSLTTGIDLELSEWSSAASIPRGG